ncbi:MAG TPA: ABC transporter permease [Anaerolineales bacterium]|nr:ABC transporter permease [Anaerolineales bacterium]
MEPVTAPSGSGAELRARRRISWGELGPRLVPALAVLTAVLFGGLFMVFSGTDWAAARAALAAEGVGGFLRELGPGIGKAGVAYEAMVEGATGLGYIDPTSVRAQTTVLVLLRLGERAIVFLPDNLVATLVRCTPFLLAGLAVAVGFKAGLFNIGAEGQLYAGALLAVWIGFVPALANLPAPLHIPLAVAGGILGGAIWGGIAGFLKARTGAHEVINTIMMNHIAIRLADWLIKSREPLILLDTTASVPRTPFIAATAEYPRLGDTPLHFGILISLGAVALVWWFLYRTTLGFELRTVGANPNAAKYAGMSVTRNLVLAMAVSGGLAGLAGAGEVLGVQHNLPPGFFAGVGFDSIAIALLAKTNPIAMIPAAFLWGGLLNGAGLMQIRADISIDLVKIIQALIVMFVAADQIVRVIWRIRARRQEEEVVFSRGWGR